MYCVNCGVKLAATENKCPLCNTIACHPEFKQPQSRPLYPNARIPKGNSGSKAMSGALLILYLIPLVICFGSDLQADGELDWFGYVAGAMAVVYAVFGLPLWFRKPNPVILTPCCFAVAALYLLYIDIATDGGWFMGFAFPVVGCLCLIICTAVTLLYYLKKGKLYILGGVFVALGGMALMIELLMKRTFAIAYIGWSIYPMIVLVLLGGFLIYLAMNSVAREMMERKLFF